MTHPDTQLLNGLIELCGHPQNGSATTVRIYQDDVTDEYLLRFGDTYSNGRCYSGSTVREVIAQAIADNEDAMHAAQGLTAVPNDDTDALVRQQWDVVNMLLRVSYRAERVIEHAESASQDDYAQDVAQLKAALAAISELPEREGYKLKGTAKAAWHVSAAQRAHRAALNPESYEAMLLALYDKLDVKDQDDALRRVQDLQETREAAFLSAIKSFDGVAGAPLWLGLAEDGHVVVFYYRTKPDMSKLLPSVKELVEYAVVRKSDLEGVLRGLSADVGRVAVLEEAAIACENIALHNSDMDGKTELVWQCAARIRALSETKGE